MKTQLQYVGDVNIEYGGSYYDLSEWHYGYASVVRVTDLDSGCGFNGGVLVEHLVVLLDKEYWKRALDCCGLSVSDLLAMDSDGRRLVLADCIMGYGHYDPDDGWDNYASHYSETLQTESDGPMCFDGWQADKRVLSENLDGYIKAVLCA